MAGRKLGAARLNHRDTTLVRRVRAFVGCERRILATGQWVCDNLDRDTKARLTADPGPCHGSNVRGQVSDEGTGLRARRSPASLSGHRSTNRCPDGHASWAGAAPPGSSFSSFAFSAAQATSTPSSPCTRPGPSHTVTSPAPFRRLPNTARGSYEQPFTSIAPVYPLVSGGIAALTRLGSHVPFPSSVSARASLRSGSPGHVPVGHQCEGLRRTFDIGYVGWLFLMAGAVAFLRAVGRGRRGWEPVTLSSWRASRRSGAPLGTSSTPRISWRWAWRWAGLPVRSGAGGRGRASCSRWPSCRSNLRCSLPHRSSSSPHRLAGSDSRWLASSPLLSSWSRSLRSPRARSIRAIVLRIRRLEWCWGHRGPAASASRLDP